ncbi:MAG: anti-sigma factor antagonist [Lachnospiraceae bacterium]|nr:anti-sigma factor antagonist [Lachnospiraceae bacterium]
MDCKYMLKDGCMTITMPKEVDHHCAEQLRKETDLLIGAYRIKRLIFDFSFTEFMDSSGIGVLIGRCKNMGYHGGEVEAANLNERVQKIFVVSGLHKIIPVTTGNSQE